MTPAKATEYADAAEAWGLQFKARFGERFVYAADEIFLLTGRSMPAASYYDAFPQLEKRHRHGPLLPRHLGRGEPEATSAN